MRICIECAQQDHGGCSYDECDCRRHDPEGHTAEALAKQAIEAQLPIGDAPDWYAQSELLLFETEAADRAISKVEQNAAAWVASANTALRRVATRRRLVTSDDVWLELTRAGVPKPHDTRAMGAVMRNGISEGWLDAAPISGDTRPKVWRSLIAIDQAA